MSSPLTLSDWLAYLERLHPKTIALGLDRVRVVHERMATPLSCPVIIVGGTNGKGSTCALLERMLLAAHYRVALYTSPHLLRYNERVRLDGVDASDDALCEAFSAVEAVRGTTPLTYFEFGTLAALWLFARAAPDAIVLEVGLGGRLDAVNIVDADVAIVTSVAIDHVDYLGATREAIGREKAGIFRAGRAAICSDRDPPDSLLDYAVEIGARLLRMGRDYGFVVHAGQWEYWRGNDGRFGLPHPALRGANQIANAATAMTALHELHDRLPVSMGAIREALVGVELTGRLQVIPGRPVVILDVAHNPEAVAALAANLGTMGFHPETLAVFGVMADKDVDGVIAAIKSRIDRWFVATLPPPRGAPASALRASLLAAGVAATSIVEFDDPAAAYRAAREAAGEADRIVAFGSFHIVAGLLPVVRPGAGSGTSGN